MGQEHYRSENASAIARSAHAIVDEFNDYCIRTFKLAGLVDAFVSSCFVYLRKPDLDIFRLALDIAQTPVSQILYLKNTAMFVQIAEGLGIRSILHMDYQTTGVRLATFGLGNDGGTIH